MRFMPTCPPFSRFIFALGIFLLEFGRNSAILVNRPTLSGYQAGLSSLSSDHKPRKQLANGAFENIHWNGRFSSHSIQRRSPCLAKNGKVSTSALGGQSDANIFASNSTTIARNNTSTSIKQEIGISDKAETPPPFFFVEAVKDDRKPNSSNSEKKYKNAKRRNSISKADHGKGGAWKSVPDEDKKDGTTKVIKSDGTQAKGVSKPGVSNFIKSGNSSSKTDQGKKPFFGKMKNLAVNSAEAALTSSRKGPRSPFDRNDKSDKGRQTFAGKVNNSLGNVSKINSEISNNAIRSNLTQSNQKSRTGNANGFTRNGHQKSFLNPTDTKLNSFYDTKESKLDAKMKNLVGDSARNATSNTLGKNRPKFGLKPDKINENIDNASTKFSNNGKEERADDIKKNISIAKAGLSKENTTNSTKIDNVAKPSSSSTRPFNRKTISIEKKKETVSDEKNAPAAKAGGSKGGFAKPLKSGIASKPTSTPFVKKFSNNDNEENADDVKKNIPNAKGDSSKENFRNSRKVVGALKLTSSNSSPLKNKHVSIGKTKETVSDKKTTAAEKKGTLKRVFVKSTDPDTVSKPIKSDNNEKTESAVDGARNSSFGKLNLTKENFAKAAAAKTDTSAAKYDIIAKPTTSSSTSSNNKFSNNLTKERVTEGKNSTASDKANSSKEYVAKATNFQRQKPVTSSPNLFSNIVKTKTVGDEEKKTSTTETDFSTGDFVRNRKNGTLTKQTTSSSNPFIAKSISNAGTKNAGTGDKIVSPSKAGALKGNVAKPATPGALSKSIASSGILSKNEKKDITKEVSGTAVITNADQSQRGFVKITKTDTLSKPIASSSNRISNKPIQKKETGSVMEDKQKTLTAKYDIVSKPTNPLSSMSKKNETKESEISNKNNVCSLKSGSNENFGKPAKLGTVSNSSSKAFLMKSNNDGKKESPAESKKPISIAQVDSFEGDSAKVTRTDSLAKSTASSFNPFNSKPVKKEKTGSMIEEEQTSSTPRSDTASKPTTLSLNPSKIMSKKNENEDKANGNISVAETKSSKVTFVKPTKPDTFSKPTTSSANPFSSMFKSNEKANNPVKKEGSSPATQVDASKGDSLASKTNNGDFSGRNKMMTSPVQNSGKDAVADNDVGLSKTSSNAAKFNPFAGIFGIKKSDAEKKVFVKKIDKPKKDISKLPSKDNGSKFMDDIIFNREERQDPSLRGDAKIVKGKILNKSIPMTLPRPANSVSSSKTKSILNEKLPTRANADKTNPVPESNVSNSLNDDRKKKKLVSIGNKQPASEPENASIKSVEDCLSEEIGQDKSKSGSDESTVLNDKKKLNDQLNKLEEFRKRRNANFGWVTFAEASPDGNIRVDNQERLNQFLELKKLHKDSKTDKVPEDDGSSGTRFKNPFGNLVPEVTDNSDLKDLKKSNDAEFVSSKRKEITNVGRDAKGEPKPVSADPVLAANDVASKSLPPRKRKGLFYRYGGIFATSLREQVLLVLQQFVQEVEQFEEEKKAQDVANKRAKGELALQQKVLEKEQFEIEKAKKAIEEEKKSLFQLRQKLRRDKIEILTLKQKSESS